MPCVIPVIPELRKQEQGNGQFKACLNYKRRLFQKWGRGRGERRKLKVNMTRRYYVNL